MSYQLQFDIMASVKQEMTAAFNKVKQQIDTAKQSLTQQGQALDKAAQQGQKYAQSQSQIGASAGKAASGVKSFGSSIGGMLTGLSAAATGILQLSRAYSDLEDTQIKVESTTKKLSVAQQAQRKAQQKVNQLVDEGKTNTPEYTEALADLEQGNKGVEIATLNHGEALEDQERAYQDFYLSVIPASLGILGALGTAMGGITSRVGAVTTGFSQMSVGARALRVAMIGIPLVAIAAALLAVRENAFGVRDMLNQLGADIGKAMPQLVPFLNWVKDLATALGLTGEALNLTEAWQLFVDGFKTAVDQIINADWGQLIQDMLSAIADFIVNADWQEVWDSIIQALEDIAEWTEKNIKPVFEEMLTAISDFITNTDWKAVWDSIVKAIQDIAEWTQKNVAPLFEQAITELAKWITTTDWTTVGSNIRSAIHGAVKWTVENVGPILSTAVTHLKTWAGNDKNWETLGTSIWTGIKNSIIAAASKEASAIGGEILGLITGKQPETKSFLGTLFPSVKEAKGEPSKGVTLGQANQMMGMPTAQKVDFDIVPAISKMDQLKAYVNTTMTQINAFFVNTKNVANIQFTGLAAQATTAFTTMKTSIQQLLGQITILFAPAFNSLPPIVNINTSLASTHFVTMYQAISGTLATITNTINTFGTGLASMAAEVNKHTSQTSTHFVTMYSSIKGTLATIETTISTFTSGMSKMASDTNKHTSQTSAHFVTMYSSIKGSIASAMREMDSLISKMKSIESQAKSTTKALNAMAEAAKKAAAAKSAAGRYGGIFLQGGGFVVDHRQKIGNVTVGEWNKPEEVFLDKQSGAMMVTPLTDPSNMHDRGQSGGGGGTGFVGSGGVGGGTPIIVNLHISGTDIINDMKLTKKIRSEGGKNYSRFI